MRTQIQEGFRMPIYKYQCGECGDFEVLRDLSERNDPCYCPMCGSESEMQIGAPYLAILSEEDRKKWEINERSKHSPQAVRRSSCGCSSSVHTCSATSTKPSEEKESKSPGLQMQTKKTARPWMLGH